MTEMKSSTTPLVSIICVTYNHGKYISKALDGFIMQETSFPFEIIVHDDASKDNTAAIIKEYELKYPDLVVTIYQKENQFSKKVDIGTEFIFPKARGKYIAFCEGDDCWTDPRKLQKQADFLEANSQYGLVHTKFSVIDENDNAVTEESLRIIQENIRDGKVFYNLLDGPNFISTLTVMFRKEILMNILRNTSPRVLSVAQDYYLWLRISDVSEIKYLDFNSANYRRTSTGLTSLGKNSNFFTPRYLVFLFDAIAQAIKGDTSFPRAKEEQAIIARKIIAYMTTKDVSFSQKFYIVNLIYRCPFVVKILGIYLINKLFHGKKGIS
jgi:glycosyltransferase involved in cell wall biosynthesis